MDMTECGRTFFIAIGCTTALVAVWYLVDSVKAGWRALCASDDDQAPNEPRPLLGHEFAWRALAFVFACVGTFWAYVRVHEAHIVSCSESGECAAFSCTLPKFDIPPLN